jgi:predicted membrane protein
MTPVDTPRRAWLDVGRADFLSNPVLITFVVVAIPTSLYIDVVATAGPFMPWFAVSAISTLAVVALLALVRGFARRRWPDGPGPWRAIVIYLAAGAVRGLLIWGAAESLGLVTSVGLLSRVMQSAVWALAVMGAASILVTRRADHHRLMHDLRKRERELLALQSTLDQHIKQTHEDLVQQVQEELGPTLAQLRAELDSLTQSGDPRTDEAVDGFRTAVADVVRPLSHALAAPIEPRAITLDVGTEDSAPRSDRIPVSRVIAPGAAAGLVLALALLTFFIAPGDFRTATVPLRVAALLVALWVGLHGLKWAARRMQWRLTLAPLLGALALAYVALAWLVGTFARAITSGLAVPEATFPAVAFALVTLAPWAVSAALALQWLARTTEVRSAETVSELEILTAILRRELWRERRRLALTVHGPIQSALVAAAVTMTRPGFTADQIPALSARLDQAMAHIDRSAGPPPPIGVAARDLAALWVGSAEITFGDTGDVLALVDADEALRTVVIEVMREGVSNAVRHGAADAITISLSRPAREIVRVAVLDDGDGAPTLTTPGLGSAMLDDVAVTWSLTRDGACTRLVVDLALEADGDDAEPTE